jgi:hypothetical protein
MYIFFVKAFLIFRHKFSISQGGNYMRKRALLTYFLLICALLSFTGLAYAANDNSLAQFAGVWVAESGSAVNPSGSIDYGLKYGRLSITAGKNNSINVFGFIDYVNQKDENWNISFDNEILKIESISPSKISWTGKWYGNISGKDYESDYEIQLELSDSGVLKMSKNDKVTTETATFKKREDGVTESINPLVGGWKAVEGSAKFAGSFSSLPLQDGKISITVSPVGQEQNVTFNISGYAYFKMKDMWQNKVFNYEKEFVSITRSNPKRFSWVKNSQVTMNGKSMSVNIQNILSLDDDETLNLKVRDKDTEATAVFKKMY